MKQPYRKSTIELFEDGYAYFIHEGTTLLHHENRPASVFIDQEYFWFLKETFYFKVNHERIT